MSNFLLHEPDCVFIHIPKTGGTSIRKGAWGQNYTGPAYGHIPENWARYFKFAFVRHPFDRLISAWKMFTTSTVNSSGWALPPDAHALTLRDFCAIVFDESIIYNEKRRTFEEKIRHHTIPQTHPFNCLSHAHFIGRFESLTTDFATVCQLLNTQKDLPHLHATGAGTGAWRSYIFGSTLTECWRFYKEDFALLGYSAS